jgi:hypothetical protein
MTALIVMTLGFFLGMRHATDADHVVAVTTILTRQKELLPAALAGLLWGLGHSLTLLVVGAAVILFNLTIPERVGLGMELSVGAMLVGLGLLNVIGFRKGASRDTAARSRSHPASLMIGVMHGLAGSAAVTVLIVAAVPDPAWAVAYLVVFGLGTIAGMMLVTVSIASTLRLAGGRSETVSGRYGLAAGVVSVIFGLAYTYQVWAA